ncbi:MAG: 6-phosphogluconolactonase [Bacteroidota bacterium]|nr:6-phosphogluconolactonase [Bacteroidota bacterium]
MKLHIFKNKEELTNKFALWISNVISETLKNQEYFTLVLSGGNTPKLLFKKLVSEEYLDKINWKRIHIFWGDERVVPFNDERNNARMAFELLIDHINIPATQVHIIRTDIEPNFAVDQYRKMLHTFFDNTSRSFDLVLLGMGDDGHTLSLFPNAPIIAEHKRWVNTVFLKAQEMYRITLMPVLVNRASKIAFMVDGAKKSNILQQVLEGDYNPSKLPSQIIKPIEGELHWFLDEAAAKDLHTL